MIPRANFLPQARWSSSMIEEFFGVDTNSGAPLPEVQKGKTLFNFSFRISETGPSLLDDVCRGRSIVPEEAYAGSEGSRIRNGKVI